MLACKNCDKQFDPPGINNRYCCGECLNAHLSRTIWKDKILKEKTREANKKRCIQCKRKFDLPGLDNLFCGKKCKKKHKPQKAKGIWKEPTKTKKYLKGVLRLSQPKKGFYDGPSWQQLRYETIKKYDRKCMVCFRTNLELHVDHIKPISKYPELALDPNNLQVLCRDCNLGKGNKDCIDWRP